MKSILSLILFLVFSSSSYAGIVCQSFCISNKSDMAGFLGTDRVLAADEIIELQLTTVGGNNDDFNDVLKECNLMVKQKDGKHAVGILVQISPQTGRLISQNTTDGCVTF